MNSESLDTTFALLSDARRRYVLYDLSRTNGTTSLSELVERVAALETGESPAVDVAALRDDRTPWVADPAGVARRQSGLDRFL